MGMHTYRQHGKQKMNIMDEFRKLLKKREGNADEQEKQI